MRKPLPKPSFVLWILVISVLVSGTACTRSADQLPRPDHIVIVIEENKSYGQIVGSQVAPFINGLARNGTLFKSSYAITHPSQPNYLALFAGSTFNVENQCPLALSGPNLAAALEEKGFSFAIFSESMPHDGYEGCGTDSEYARRHNPVVNWGGRLASAAINKTFARFPREYDKLPTVAIVVPNQANDMHDGKTVEDGIARGDAWLAANLQGYVEWAQKNNSLLIVTWDEDDYSEANKNQIATIFAGAMVTKGVHGQRIDHYDVLRTVLDMYGLTPFGEAQKARPITGIWKN